MYEIGQKVVCVESDSYNHTIKDSIYNVSGIVLCGCGNLGLQFKDFPQIHEIRVCIHCNNVRYGQSTAFKASRFRPLDDLYNTEIEELMNEVNERVPFEL